ncbi:SGNH/GDSL hydrolase family protein [Metabacillus litoralis]|uniref:SGNH/GDSL hydrolase family protein n=1 Tax=Metabacillus litoralis TaxID=152268 RepID=UPI001CFDAD7E|nr:SGNH/GDSL hydrolase family protein [Metabacillus litoralis]
MNKKRVLFIGDSITEWGRYEDQENIGTGYVRLIHDYFVTSYPSTQFEFINRGVGGDRISDLQARWQDDAIEIDPDYISISIGINDVWRQIDNPDLDQISPERFQEIYEELLSLVKSKTKATVILMEPTIIEEDTQAPGNQMLIEYLKVIYEVAKKFEVIVVPTHKAFIKYLESGNEYKLTIDGVHMNSAGNMLMAKTWINEVEKVIK